MVASQTLTFDTASSASPGGEAWSNPTNALLSDDSRAVVNFLGVPSNASEFLHVSGHSRTVQPEAELLGIQINYEWRATEGNADANTIVLEENGVQPSGSDTKARSLPGSEQTDSVPTGTSDLWNARFHTFNDLAARGFGVGTQAELVSGAETQAQIDQITATVHYNVPCRGRSRTLRRWPYGFR